MSDEHLRYPIGKFQRLQGTLTPSVRHDLIAVVERAPAELKHLATGLTEAQLETTYRPGGWTVRQVLHHVPDSHMNAYIRTKLAATVDAPLINAYDERQWAEMRDGRSGPVSVSLALLESLHARWTTFWRELSPEQLQRVYVHPDMGRVTLDECLTLYAWHSRHHTAHVRQALGRSA